MDKGMKLTPVSILPGNWEFKSPIISLYSINCQSIRYVVISLSRGYIVMSWLGFKLLPSGSPDEHLTTTLVRQTVRTYCIHTHIAQCTLCKLYAHVKVQKMVYLCGIPFCCTVLIVCVTQNVCFVSSQRVYNCLLASYYRYCKKCQYLPANTW